MSYRGRSRSRSRSRERGRSREDRGGERVSVLVRNLPLDARAEEVRAKFERYGPIRDIYLPKDFYSGRPKGFGFIEFLDRRDGEEAIYNLDRTMFGNREIQVCMSKEGRKTPRDMMDRERGPGRGPPPPRGGYGGGRARSRTPAPALAQPQPRLPPPLAQPLPQPVRS
ncbi:hypothetical protein COHA_010460 [Chlorella ohadii]|uniref:RRM domain-containing protein n=1 Tax=Chlorella ohadii TaxID=2649997 RepID=A0AAD5DFC5_9CHLO|nr:hypothetical protein COHA_010460 [Chlorella ohadii]